MVAASKNTFAYIKCMCVRRASVYKTQNNCMRSFGDILAAFRRPWEYIICTEVAYSSSSKVHVFGYEHFVHRKLINICTLIWVVYVLCVCV